MEVALEAAGTRQMTIPSPSLSPDKMGVMTVFDYLTVLPKKTLKLLYKDPWICQAVFRSLSPVSKQYVLRLLFVDSVPAEKMRSWITPTARETHKECIRRLSALSILERKQEGSEKQAQYVYYIYEEFKQKIITIMCNGLASPLSPVEDNKHKPSLEELDKFWQTRWEDILYYLLTISTSANAAFDYRPSDQLLRLLEHTRLIQKERTGREITNYGFQFLMKDISTQIWTLLLSYIEKTEGAPSTGGASGEESTKTSEALSLLFRLSFLKLGEGYPISALSTAQTKVLHDLSELCLVYRPQNDSKLFYPTRLALNLAVGQLSSGDDSGFIIVETNYRLYAYTDSELKISLLSLFAKLIYRLPNLVVGIITRASIRYALMRGITAEQIIKFMHQNAHPQMLNRIPRIPETITDQIRLWELERNRITYQKGWLIDHFPSEAAFKEVVKFTKEKRTYIWSNDSKQLLFVTEESLPDIRDFSRKQEKRRLMERK